MTTTKKLSLILLTFTFTLFLTPDAFCGIQKQNNGNKGKKKVGESSRQIGAPLDGGLLTLLGAAGAGYYLMRKKKKLSSND